MNSIGQRRSFFRGDFSPPFPSTRFSNGPLISSTAFFIGPSYLVDRRHPLEEPARPPHLRRSQRPSPSEEPRRLPPPVILKINVINGIKFDVKDIPFQMFLW